jgi:cysteine-rich repeat protein
MQSTWSPGRALRYLVACLLVPHSAEAVCNAIPAATDIYRGALGSLNRPFASPGDYVGVEVRTAICDRESAGLSLDASQYVVTVLFAPPPGSSQGANGAPHAVVLTDDCTSVATQLSACQATLAPVGGSAVCQNLGVQPGAAELFLRDEQGQLGIPRRELFFRFPEAGADFGLAAGHTLSGPAKVIVTAKGAPLQCGLASQTCRAAELADASFAIACIDQIFELDGSCDEGAGDVDPTFGHFTALPPPNDFAALCDPQPGPADPAEPCQSGAAELLATTDAAGNVLVPFDYSGVLKRSGVGADGLPVARLGRIDTNGIEAFRGTAGLLILTDPDLVSSHAPEGLRLPAVFTPLLGASANLALFGSLDAPRGVIRLAPALQQCVGGLSDGELCSDADDCTGGSCVRPAPLFEFRDRYADAGTGPVAIPDLNYALAAQTSLQLSGVQETSQLFTLLVNESVEGRDLNGDGDQNDLVASVASKSDGSIANLSLGIARQASNGILTPILAAEDDKVVAVVSEARQKANLNGDLDASDAIVMAFERGSTMDLLSGQDVSEPPEVEFEREAVTLPLLDRRALRVANGLAYYSTIENLGGWDTRLWASQAADGGAADGPSGAARTADRPPIFGPWVIFDSRATNLLPTPRTHGFSEIYIRGANGTIALASAGDLRNPPAPPPDGDAFAPDITPSARFIGFESRSSSVLPGLDTNGAFDVFLIDLDPDENGAYADLVPGEDFAIERVNLDEAGDPPASGLECPLPGGPVTWGSRETHISPNGRYVLFSSESQLTSNDVNTSFCTTGGSPSGDIDFIAGIDVYLRDRATGTTEAISIVDGTSGTPLGVGAGSVLNALRHPFVNRGGLGVTLGRRISESGPNAGRYVVFDSLDPLSAEDDDGFCWDVYLRDRVLDRTILVSKLLDPSWEAVACAGAAVHEISADGERVLFGSYDPGYLRPEERTGCPLDPLQQTGDACPFNVLEYEVATGQIRLVSRGVDGRNAAPGSHLAFFVDQGDPLNPADDPDRPNPFVVYYSPSTHLVEDDEDTLQDLFVGEKHTGFAQRGFTLPSFSSLDSLSIGGAAAICTQDPLSDDDNNGSVDVLLSYLDMTDDRNQAEDLNGENGLSDGFFQVFDLRNPASSTSLLGFFRGAVAPDGAIAFLRGERRGTENVQALQFFAGRSGGTGPLLTEDAVEAVRPAGDSLAFAVEQDSSFVNPGRVLGISETRIAAIQDLGPLAGVVHVWSRNDLANPVAPQYQGSGLFANALLVRGDTVGLGVSEAAQGARLNGDADLDDSVGFLYFADTDQVRNTGRHAEDGVLGDQIAAFRTSEAREGQSLNGDLDQNDFVLHVVDYAGRNAQSPVISTGSSAVACTFEVCDPTQPYRIKGRTVRFLTREQDEGRDLNDDFDTDDLVVQLFNLDAARAEDRLQVIATVEQPSDLAAPGLAVDPLADPPFSGGSEQGDQIVITRGVCVDAALKRGPTCNTDADCLVGAGETCALELAAAGSADGDADGIPDALDNCPTTSNAAQADADADRVGDACDVETCGNGSQEGSEECDDGDLDDGDGCTRFCKLGGLPGDVNLDGKVDQTDVEQIDDAGGCFPCEGACNPVCDLTGDGQVDDADRLALEHLIETPDLPPVLGPASASPAVLWPPNQKLVDVTVSYSVTDDSGTPLCTLGVAGGAAGDSEVVDAHHVRLRAARPGKKGTERTYTITVTCTDAAGGSASTQTAVVAPRDQGKSKKE